MSKEFETQYRRALREFGYEYIGVIGTGGMSRVDEVRRLTNGRRYALKHLGPSVPREKRERYRRTLRREAEYQFEHPNVMRVLESFEDKDNVYLIMPRMQHSLKYLLDRKRRYPLAGIIDIMHQSCAGLIYLHQQGVVHRDMKPSNILYNEGGDGLQVVLADFGLSLDSWAQLTRFVKRTIRAHVQKAGTPTYASPEQMRRGGKCDRRSDVYSLGRIMDDLFLRVVREHRDYPKTPAQKRRLKHLEKGIYLYKRDEAGVLHASVVDCLPYDVQQLVLECLQKDPERRPQDASSVYYQLSRVLLRYRTQRSMQSGLITAAGQAVGR